MSFLTAIKTRMFFRLSVLESQYKLNPECETCRFPKNGSYLYIISALRLNPALSTEIVYLYFLPQFCYITNINNLEYGLALLVLDYPRKILVLDFFPSFLFHLFLD